MGQLRDLLQTGIGLAVENSNRSRTGPSPPARVYDASRYERAPIPQDDSNSRGIPQTRYDLQSRNNDNPNWNTRRGRRLDRRNQKFADQGRLLGGLRGGAGQRRPTLIGGMRDLLTSHMTQDQDAMRGARPASFSNNTNAMQPATRTSPQYYPQGRHYPNPNFPSSQQRQRSVSDEDEDAYYSDHEHVSREPYYADELEPQYQHANDLPPRYEARPADQDWNSRYEPRASTAPPTRRPREKEEYCVPTL